MHYPGTCAAGCFNRVHDTIGDRTVESESMVNRGRIGHELDLQLRAGEPATVDKVVALLTSRDVGISEPAVPPVDLIADAPGFDALLVEHELAWRRLWRRFRVELTDGGAPTTASTLRTLRLSLFHVLQAVSPDATALDAGVPARGLHGEAYRGHVF